ICSTRQAAPSAFRNSVTPPISSRLPPACFTGVPVILATRRRLLQPNPPRNYLCLRVALRTDRMAMHSAQHGELPHMPERVCERPLDEPLQRAIRQVRFGDLAIQLPEALEESSHLRVPAVAPPGGPDVLTAGERPRPVHEITEVRHNPP